MPGEEGRPPLFGPSVGGWGVGDKGGQWEAGERGEAGGWQHWDCCGCVLLRGVEEGGRGPREVGTLGQNPGGGGDPWSKDTAGERQPLLRSVIDDRA